MDTAARQHAMRQWNAITCGEIDGNFKLQAQSVDLRKADATQLPFQDSSIDCVYSFGVLHHIPEAERVMAEVFRVPKPGGRVMLALYYRWSPFHLFTKLLCHGIRCGWLWTKGYAGLLATIEDGADGVTTKPYVKLYSRREMRRLVRQFRVTDLSVHQLTADHFYPAVVGRALRRLIPRLEGLLGWYVTCKATKPA